MPLVRRLRLIPLLLTFATFAITGCGGSGDSNGSTVEVPNVTGKPVAEARAAITGVGLKVLVQRGASEKPAGKVVHQEPPAGSEVPETRTITLYVSSGSTKVEGPPPPPSGYEPTTPSHTTSPPAVAPGPTEEDLRAALDDADPTEFGAVATGLNVKQIERFPRVLNITLETPEGGFEGASVADLDGSAAAAFKAVYDDAGWQGGTTVKFTGGLVDSRTGRDLPNAETGLYRLTAREAQQIDWGNATSVDWSFYRLFAHPALKD